jgi:hypothetical protein
MRPAITLHSANAAFALQGQGDIGTDRLYGFALGARLGLRAAPLPLQLTARLDTDGALRRESFSFGFSVGGETRAGAVVTASGDLRVPDAASLHFVSERSNGSRRRGRH